MSLVFKKMLRVHQKNQNFVFQFASELDSQFLTLQKEKVAQWLSHHFWKGIDWSVVIAEEVAPQAPVIKVEDKKADPLENQVKMFKTIFRGEVVPPKEDK